MERSVGKKSGQALLVFVLAAAVFCFFFRGLMLSPNLYAPTFGGDGLTIHYNLFYHAAYGDGADLQAQYHPHTENIFLTDAQSLLAVALAELRPVFPHLHQYAVGFSNGLIFWSNPLAALFLFLILRRLGVRWGVALAGGLFIAMLSPQILRQLGGQYTLGYTFLLPLLIWYLLSYEAGRSYWWRSLLAATVVILAGINNPYLYAICGAFLLGAVVLAALAKWLRVLPMPGRMVLHWLGVFLLTTGVVFLTVKGFDTVEDRVEVPFGFFHNTATWGGLLTSPKLFTYAPVRRILIGLAQPYRETPMYLGIIPILLTLILPVLWVYYRARRRSLTVWKSPVLTLLLASSVLGLIFGFGLPFAWVEDWTYAHLGSILQFRAPVRFAWPFYYVLGLVAVCGLDWIAQTRKKRWAGIAWWVLPLAVWGIEANQYLNFSLEDHYYSNAFRPSELRHFGEIAKARNIDTAQFSSIYLLPSEQGWSDKIYRDGSWRSNHDGYKLSLATSLPLLNGKLSRVSLGWVLKSLQVVSHPLIDKALLEEIDRGKDIVLLTSLENPLSAREDSLRQLGEVLYSNDKMELRRLRPEVLAENHRTARQAALADTLLTTQFINLPTEEDPAHAFVGKGSRKVGPGWTDIWSLDHTALPGSGPYEISFWYFVDKTRFGGPKFYFRTLDAEGKIVEEQYQWTNEAWDTQRGWLRMFFTVAAAKPGHRSILYGDYFHHYWLDAFLLRPQDRNVRVVHDDGVLYNNYWLPK
ncbi:hypothetical protein QWY85_09395 [Neolewinella lacunae]|uniref:DUF6311 domain-containing protein n=1 Tax=Neolewinella lacunae TaxID=1517758 RepID=A0A923TAK0_9BACT|nr:hypothetical protein [Neolewinella lacunae]MBC6996564.1 hypothetical protein [Neolewinella lacunae]MDN3634872.1 hypothetical protein [Neolewinella lacunae]